MSILRKLALDANKPFQPPKPPPPPKLPKPPGVATLATSTPAPPPTPPLPTPPPSPAAPGVPPPPDPGGTIGQPPPLPQMPATSLTPPPPLAPQMPAPSNAPLTSQNQPAPNTQRVGVLTVDTPKAQPQQMPATSTTMPKLLQPLANSLTGPEQAPAPRPAGPAWPTYSAPPSSPVPAGVEPPSWARSALSFAAPPVAQAAGLPGLFALTDLANSTNYLQTLFGSSPPGSTPGPAAVTAPPAAAPAPEAAAEPAPAPAEPPPAEAESPGFIRRVANIFDPSRSIASAGGWVGGLAGAGGAGGVAAKWAPSVFGPAGAVPGGSISQAAQIPYVRRLIGLAPPGAVAPPTAAPGGIRGLAGGLGKIFSPAMVANDAVGTIQNQLNGRGYEQMLADTGATQKAVEDVAEGNINPFNGGFMNAMNVLSQLPVMKKWNPVSNINTIVHGVPELARRSVAAGETIGHRAVQSRGDDARLDAMATASQAQIKRLEELAAAGGLTPGQQKDLEFQKARTRSGDAYGGGTGWAGRRLTDATDAVGAFADDPFGAKTILTGGPASQSSGARYLGIGRRMLGL